MRALSSVIFGVLVGLGLAAGCRSPEPQGRPEIQCNEACNARASKRCTDFDCERGCRFVLDRLVEHEGNQVVSCVAAGKGACDDAAWADCAVRVGVHVDGGPPAPPKAASEED